MPRIKNEVVAEQAQELLSLIREVVQYIESYRSDISPIPALRACFLGDGPVLIDWEFPDFTVGFNIELDAEQSGWHIISNKRLGLFTASGQLTGRSRMLIELFRFIFSHI